jgi:hypothetical protein
LYGGTLTVINQIPVASDFIVNNLNQTMGSTIPVTIIPKDGKSPGWITIYFNGNTWFPSAAGTYTVTFDVEAAPGWDRATGLAAGTLIITNAEIGIGDPFIRLYMDGSLLENGGTTIINHEPGIFIVSINTGTYTEIIWRLNGNIVIQGATVTSITLSKQIPGTYQVTVEATPAGGTKNSGSHNFVVQ